MRNPRLLVAAGVVLAAIAAGVVLMAGSGGDPPARDTSTGEVAPEVRRTVRAELTLEQAVQPDRGGRELLVSLPGPQFNTPALARGAPLVSLRCFDARGSIVIDQQVDWPLPEEAGFPPHIHRPAAKRELDVIRRCRVTAPGIDFAGSVPGRLPLSG